MKRAPAPRTPPRTLTRAWDDAYRQPRPPWDSGRPSPQLAAFLKAGVVRPGPALELGCGTGTNALYLARRGFAVTAVDASQRALRQARAKARAAGVLTTGAARPGTARFLWGDATDLWDLPVADFVFDRGCFHTLEPGDRKYYRDSLLRATRPGSVYLMLCGSPKEHGDSNIPKLPKTAIRAAFRRHFHIPLIADIRFEGRPRTRPGPRGYACVLVRKGGSRQRAAGRRQPGK